MYNLKKNNFFFFFSTTKSHRRVGSIGSKGDARVWPGRKLPGHMGYEWRHAHSLEVLRINPIKQVNIKKKKKDF